MNIILQPTTILKIKKILGIIVLILAACILYGFFAGFRANLGEISQMIDTAFPLISYADINNIFFIFTLVDGLMTPVMGYLTVKKSNLFVLVLGCIFIAIGMSGIALCSTLAALAISIDVFLACGSSALSFAVLYSLVAPCIGNRAAAIASGVINCSSTFFATLLAPGIALVTDLIGFNGTMMMFVLVALIFIPLSIVLALFHRRQAIIPAEKKKSIRFTQVCRMIFRSPWFYMVLPCFFIYGFSCQGITNHLFADYTSSGISNLTGSVILSAANFAMTIGMLVIGVIAARSNRHLRLISIIVISIIVLELCYAVLEPSLLSIACLLALCIFGGAILPMASIITTDMTDPIYIATALGIMHFISKTSQGLNFQMGGYIFDTTGTILPLCLLQTAVAIMGAAIMFIAMRKVCADRKKAAADKQAGTVPELRQ